MRRLPLRPNGSCLRSIVAAIFVGIASLGSASNAQEDPLRSDALVKFECPSSRVTVRSRDPLDAQSTCRGALAAIDFFRAHGAETKEPIQIDVVDQLPLCTRSAVGCFRRGDHQAYVLSYQAFGNRPNWFGLPTNRRLYEAIASHETAHALTLHLAASRSTTAVANEYIAFVTMFATLDPGHLELLLAAHPGIAFDSERELSFLAYALGPVRFGVMAYRHFLQQPDRVAFFRAVLARTALAFPYDYYY